MHTSTYIHIVAPRVFTAVSQIAQKVSAKITLKQNIDKNA